jgi:hypothetical protein
MVTSRHSISTVRDQAPLLIAMTSSKACGCTPRSLSSGYKLHTTSTTATHSPPDNITARLNRFDCRGHSISSSLGQARVQGQRTRSYRGSVATWLRRAAACGRRHTRHRLVVRQRLIGDDRRRSQAAAQERRVDGTGTSAAELISAYTFSHQHQAA